VRVGRFEKVHPEVVSAFVGVAQKFPGGRPIWILYKNILENILHISSLHQALFCHTLQVMYRRLLSITFLASRVIVKKEPSNVTTALMSVEQFF